MMLVEEGLSTYFPAIDTNRHIWNLLSLNKTGFSLVKTFSFRLIERYLRNRFELNTLWVNFNLLVKRGDILFPNNFSIKYYRRVLLEYAERVKKFSPKLSIINNSVVICTMAYLHSEIKEYSDVSTLKLVVSELKKKGFTVYLKPHPRDVNYKIRYSTLNCEFIDFPYSIEVLLIIYPQIRYIVSFSSTSLVTAKLLLGLESISILKFVDKEKYGQYIIEEMDSFINCFSNLVDMPDNINDFGRIFPDNL